MTSVTELRRLVDADPAAAVQAATAEVRRGRGAGDVVVTVDALACLGRGRRLLGEIDLAEAAFVEAIAVADEAGRADLAADGHLGLAALRWHQGRSEEVDHHLEIAERYGSPRTQTEVRLQRAGIAQLLGRFDEALAAYGAVIPELEAAGARLELARVLSNRAVIRSNRAEAADAIADLERAINEFTAAGLRFPAAQVTHNLGATYARIGDFPRALRHLDRAADELVALGHDAHDVEIARAQALLAAGLVGDARRAADELSDRLRATGNAVRAAEVDLLSAAAARLDGDAGAAADHADGAARFFAKQESVGWHRAAQLEGLLARADGGVLGDDDLRILESLAVACGRSGDILGEIRVRALQARVVPTVGGAAQAAADVARIAAVLGTFEARTLERSSAASALLAAGDADGALAAAEAAVTDLAAHRATLGSVDARAHAATHVARLMDLGLALALRTGSSAAVLRWMGWRRDDMSAAGVASAAPDVVGALDRVRRAEAAAANQARNDGLGSGGPGSGGPGSGGPGSGGAASDALVEVREAEDRYRRCLLRSEGTGPARQLSITARALRRAAGRTVVVFDESGGRLHAVVVGPKRSRLVDVVDSDAVRLAARIVGRSAAGMLSGAEGARAVRRAAFEQACRELDESVLARLGRLDGDLVIVPSMSVADVPWGSLPSLVDRAVTVAPSPAWIVEGVDDRPHPGSVLVAAGPDLDHADTEAELVAKVWPGADVLSGSLATTSRVRAGLGSAAVAHLVAHGSFRADNPLWSAIGFHDGRLSAYELESIERLPHTVVLSSCDAGRSGAGGPSGFGGSTGMLGLAAMFLRLGVSHAVAAVAPLPDLPETGSAMVVLHQHLSSGVSPPEALRRARAADPSGALAVVVCFGR